MAIMLELQKKKKKIAQVESRSAEPLPLLRVITQTQWSRHTEVLYVCHSGKPGVSPALSEFSRIIL